MTKGKEAKHIKPTKISELAKGNPMDHEDFLTDSSTHAEETEKEYLGDRIRKARERRGLTIGDLGSRTGIDIDTLKSLESNEMIPPLSQLIRLGKALEMKMGSFISPGVNQPMTLVRADQREPISRYGKETSERYGYFYESLAPQKANRMMEPFVVTLLPTDVEEPSSHDGQEFLFVLEGEMKVQVGDRIEFLSPGDAVYYDANQPHLVRCVGESEAKIVAVIYTGLG